VKNGGTSDVGVTQVRVSTDGAAFEERVATPTLTANGSADLKFDRGPLVGFAFDWKFSVVIDPDGKHGGPIGLLKGECTDLRSRAQAGMVPLATWYDTGTGLWNHTDWWTSANQLETVIDYSRETGDTQYFDEIENTFVKNSSKNFDKYGFYDDDGWFLIAWIKAYELSHQQKYLDMAKVIFTRMTGGWDSKCGGGIYWASAENGQDGLKNKNAIPNELFLTGAARLHRLTPGDTGPGSYLDWAQREWAWFKGTGMINAEHQIVDGLTDLTSCKPSGPIFSYNQGALISGLVDLSVSSGDMAPLTEANAIAHATMTKMASANGILKEPGCGGDICVQFKGVFIRNLAYLYRASPLPEYQAYMRKQSDQLWNSNRDAQKRIRLRVGPAVRQGERQPPELRARRAGRRRALERDEPVARRDGHGLGFVQPERDTRKRHRWQLALGKQVVRGRSRRANHVRRLGSRTLHRRLPASTRRRGRRGQRVEHARLRNRNQRGQPDVDEGRQRDRQHGGRDHAPYPRRQRALRAPARHQRANRDGLPGRAHLRARGVRRRALELPPPEARTGQ
jgi:predicted alpha-1,6-mannanase (GH76 family)